MREKIHRLWIPPLRATQASVRRSELLDARASCTDALALATRPSTVIDTRTQNVCVLRRCKTVRRCNTHQVRANVALTVGHRLCDTSQEQSKGGREKTQNMDFS